MANTALCVHGHFYQPPREDPLTGEIPIEPGAAPYRNWNERIHAQCYYPNTLLRNFERISFNIGPTLMEWMFDYDPETQANIIQQNQRNFEEHGVGNAMAQAYNHTILPLAPPQDKVTQIRWGIADFEYRFGHRPGGIWLPETAVDDETLSVLVDCGIQFTILAPWQADSSSLDPSQPYRVALPGGREISVFFYDQELSTRVSFDPASTVNADRFLSEYILPRFNLDGEKGKQPQFIMISSDGELYGHHQPFRDKFLAYLLSGALKDQSIELTYPALWLKKNPPSKKIKILQNTSWSCHHGVLRWSGSCNCTPNSGWKQPFRHALDLLANALDEEYLKILGHRMENPWELRHRYIAVLHGQVRLEDLAEELCQWTPTERELQKLQALMRAQYERQRMFTSCGWFFDDYDRIEPKNNTAYAAQATWLTRLATGMDLSELAGEELEKVVSWRSGLKADAVFMKHLQRARRVWD
jgi:alpha-amylase/alpha-mannosidase (GH57 family)